MCDVDECDDDDVATMTMSGVSSSCAGFRRGAEAVASDKVVREASWNFGVCDSCDHFA